MLESVSQTIQRKTGGALHRQIAAEIERAILAGEIEAGSQLPKNRDMSRALNVSPMTVQGAIRTLSARGLVVHRRRVGTFVADPIPAKVGRVAAVMMYEPAACRKIVCRRITAEERRAKIEERRSCEIWKPL